MLHIMKPYAEDAIEDGVVVWQRAEGESIYDNNFTPDYEDLSYCLNSWRISTRFNVRNVLSAYAKEKMYWQKTSLLRAENSTLLKYSNLERNSYRTAEYVKVLTKPEAFKLLNSYTYVSLNDKKGLISEYTLDLNTLKLEAKIQI